jgi:predicted FMN-binding regulatory protein PaiB
MHACGTLMFKPDPECLMRHLRNLTYAHEQNRPKPWAVTGAPDDYVAQFGWV